MARNNDPNATTIKVQFGKEALSINFQQLDPRIKDIKLALEGRTGIPPSNQRLISKGKVLEDEREVSGLRKLLLVGSKAEDVELAIGTPAQSVRVRDDLAGDVVPKGFKRVPLPFLMKPEERSPYRFERIEILPGLPEQDRAREILESLANDPGIMAVLAKHRWTVGALCEMMPEGQVGISDVCVMGLNENRGQRILLRLRTDDLAGFRKILSIRKVLYHELSHNVYGEHDNDFYQLMRQVEREATELDWTQQGGRAVNARRAVHRMDDAGAAGGGGGYVLVREAFEGGSGRLGGSSEVLTGIFSARELAAQAAVLRLSEEEKEVEEACGCGGRPRSSGGNQDGSSSGNRGDGSSGGDYYGKDHPHNNDDGAAAAVSALPLPPRPAGAVASLLLPPRLQKAESHPGAAGPAATTIEAGAEAALVPEPMDDSPLPGNAEPDAAAKEGQRQEVQGAATGIVTPTMAGVPSAGAANDHGTAMDVVDGESILTTAVEEAGAALVASAATSATMPLPATTVRALTPLHELLAMGFDRDVASVALRRTGGSISQAVEQLLLGNVNAGVSSSEGGATENVGASNGTAFALPAAAGSAAVAPSRQERLEAAAAVLAADPDRGRAAAALDTLLSMVHALLINPSEQKFRRVRLTNKRFAATAGARPEGRAVLEAAGFALEADGEHLELKRDDPGLLWLAAAVLEKHRASLEP